VINPAKSLEDDQKFGKALVEGFIEPYKKSWSEGKYFEVAGRAAFDVGSLFIGAGEANAAIKGGAAASKTAEVANVASKAGKAAEVANVAGKTAEVANVAGKTGEAANVASKSGKAAEVASTAGKATEVAEATGKTGKASEAANLTDKVADSGKGTKTTTEAIEGADKAADAAKASKNVDFAEGAWDGKRHAGAGNLGGQRISRKELKGLAEELGEHGIELNHKGDKAIRQLGGGENARGAFHIDKDGNASVVLRAGATKYEAFHEMTHARQYMELGREAYVKLGTYARESHVFNEIWKNRRLFNKNEVNSAIGYMRRLRRQHQGY
jgi:Metallopeptidase toxin 4